MIPSEPTEGHLLAMHAAAQPLNVVTQAAQTVEAAAALSHPATMAVPVTAHPTFPAGQGVNPASAHAGVIGVPITLRESLRRIPLTLDPISPAAAGQDAAVGTFRLAANTKVFGGLNQIRLHAAAILETLSQTKVPDTLVGVLHQPDGTGAARVQLQFNPASLGVRGPVTTTLTADTGAFTLAMPSGLTLPTTGLSLTVHGAHNQATVTLTAAQIAANGVVGVVILPVELAPMPVSILAALRALTPVDPAPAAAPPPPAPVKHTVKVGEPDSVSAQSFTMSERTERFPWGLFFRIVEPEMSIATHTREFPIGAMKTWMPVYRTEAGTDQLPSKLVDRIPIDQPLSVDGFRDQIAGIDTAGTFTGDEAVPMAASIGLGYILRLAQQWDLQSLGLGDLIYSLPLAPGEQQQIAVFERHDTSSVQERESFSQAQTMAQTASSDTSALATFNQAFNEMVSGSSSFSTSSSTESAGVGFGIGPIGFGGSAGGSSSSGHQNESLQGSRDTVSQAAQATHSNAENHASAKLTANRTGMRLASASENMGITTKTITNHNHTHALTMQYWEVVRNYEVSTTIEGLTLCCLIPMQVVRFMPPGQPRLLTDPAAVDSAAKVMERYKNILRHLDILQRVIPYQFQHGLNLLGQFAANPTTVVDSAAATAETVIKFELAGNFLSCERVSVTAVTKYNTRIGPVRLTPAVAGQPAAIPANQFMTKDELVSWLVAQRQTTRTTLDASLAIPPQVNRSDIVGFEIDREFTTVSYTLTSAAHQAAQQFLDQQLHQTQVSFGDFLTEAVKAGGLAPLPTVTLDSRELEPLLGGPTLVKFHAAVENPGSSGQDVPAPRETYVNGALNGTVLPPQPFPVPALQIAPVLRFQDVLEIEKAAQHIVRNTTRYSAQTWLSLTKEEVAILLDGYTIGVPAGGLQDASQMIPLMNCVQNNIVGVFGNSLIMPFTIPQDLADQVGVKPAELQQALLDFQRENFVSPQSMISLPTRGVLGEAVLGSSPSAEKIDLTRFWNWQDAPADTAPGIGEVQMPTTTPPLTTGVTAPNSLTNLAPLINNLITAPQPNPALLQSMAQVAGQQQDFNPSLTGQQELSAVAQKGQQVASDARASALSTAQTLSQASIQQMSDLVKAAMGAGGSGTNTPPANTNGANTKNAPTKTSPSSKAGNSGKTPSAPATNGTPSASGAAADSSSGGLLDTAGAGDLAPGAADVGAGGEAAGAVGGLGGAAEEIAPIAAAAVV